MDNKDGDGLGALRWKWFEKGKNAILRTNKSGCCCVFDDNDNLIVTCGAHQEWFERMLNGIKENG